MIRIDAIEQLRTLPTGTVVAVHGKLWRIVPVPDGHVCPCQSCKLLRQRNTCVVCPGYKTCCARHRPDNTSVKYISADAPYKT